jgi:hypothetical protein
MCESIPVEAQRQWMQRALTIRAQQFGPQHPSTPRARKNYVMLIRKMEREEK